MKHSTFVFEILLTLPLVAGLQRYRLNKVKAEQGRDLCVEEDKASTVYCGTLTFLSLRSSLSSDWTSLNISAQSENDIDLQSENWYSEWELSQINSTFPSCTCILLAACQ